MIIFPVSVYVIYLTILPDVWFLQFALEPLGPKQSSESHCDFARLRTMLLGDCPLSTALLLK